MRFKHQNLVEAVTWVKSLGDAPFLYPARVIGDNEAPGIRLTYKHAGGAGLEARKQPPTDALCWEGGLATLAVFVVRPEWPELHPFRDGVTLPIGVTLLWGSDRRGADDRRCLNSATVLSELVGRSEDVIDKTTLHDDFAAREVVVRIPKKTSHNGWSNGYSWTFGNDVSNTGMWTKMPFDATGEWGDIAVSLRAMALAYTAFLTLVKGTPLDEPLEVELRGEDREVVKAIVPVKSLDKANFPGRLPACRDLLNSDSGVDCMGRWMRAFMDTGPEGDRGVKLDLLTQWFELGDRPPFALMEGVGRHLLPETNDPGFEQCVTKLATVLDLQKVIKPHKNALRVARNDQQHQGRQTSWDGRYRNHQLPHLAELLLIFGFLHIGMGDAMPSLWRKTWIEKITAFSQGLS